MHPHISIKAEPLFEIAGFNVTNSYFTSLIVIALFCLLAYFYNLESSKKNKNSFFYLMQYALKMLHDFFKSVLHEKIMVFFPLIGALFFYIIMQNWFGLLPGVGSLLIAVGEKGGEVERIPLLRADTADLNTTIALGIIAVISIQYYGFKFLRADYIKKFINFKSPLDFVLGFLEIISEISRVVSFAFRLFGNIFAGEVLITIISFLVPVLASFPFLMLEIFVGFVQALVFSMLTAVFLNMATAKHH